MIERTLARRYAEALLAAAERAGLVTQIEEEILGLAELYRREEGLRRLLEHPFTPAREKSALARRLLQGRVQPLLLDFLDAVLRKGRVRFLPDMASVFDDIADRSRGVIKATVESFRPLTDAQRRLLEAKLVKLHGGRKVVLEERVEAALLGGVRVRIRDQVLDGTAAGRLKAVRDRLLEVV